MNKLAAAVAVIGTGSIGTRHLRVLRRIQMMEPVAIPKRQEQLGLLESQGFSTARDLDGAIRKGVGLCVIASDTSQHLPDGLLALDKGLDVLMEKPLGKDRTEAHRLRERARAAGRKLFVACVLRFSESLGAFRDLLPRVGRVHSVRIEAQSYLPDWRPGRDYGDSYSARADEGGVLRDMVHEIDYAGWIFGWPASLQAVVKNLGRLGIADDEVAQLNWETPYGCTVSIDLDYLTRPPRRRMMACGEWGTIEWDGIAQTVTLAVGAGAVEETKSAQTRDEMLLAQAGAFIDSTRAAGDPRLATAEDGVKALAVCDAARRASDSRREERVDYP